MTPKAFAPAPCLSNLAVLLLWHAVRQFCGWSATSISSSRGGREGGVRRALGDMASPTHGSLQLTHDGDHLGLRSALCHWGSRGQNKSRRCREPAWKRHGSGVHCSSSRCRLRNLPLCVLPHTGLSQSPPTRANLLMTHPRSCDTNLLASHYCPPGVLLTKP